MQKNKILKNKNGYTLFHDAIMIFIGILLAIILVKTGLLELAIGSIKDYYILASFIAGIFFTSIFTIAPSSVALVSIANDAPIPGVVVFAGLGAMCGDLILFFFIRDRFTANVMSMMKKTTVKHIMRSFHFGFLKWLAPLIGALIIASPLPDEFAITLLGISKTKTAVLIPLSFIMNAIGVYLLIGFSHLL